MAQRDKQQEIMAAAEKLFTGRRFHEITLDEVAREARVGKGTIYLYFTDKEDLFFRTATSGFDDMCRLLQRGLPASESFQQRLLNVCNRINAFFERRRPLIRMMQVEEGRVYGARNELGKRWMAEREKLVTAVAEILSQGAEQDLIRRDIPPRILTGYLLAMLRARNRDMLEEPQAQKSLEGLLDLFYNGASRNTGELKILTEK